MSTFSATADPDDDDDRDPGDDDVLTGVVVGTPPPAFASPALNSTVITVIAYKGGVGKSTLAYELAYLLGGVLVDFEYDGGAVTVTWGYRYQDRLSAPIITALERDRAPVPLKGTRKPDLVPGHPELAMLGLSADATANALEAWAREWKRPVIVDTHPGGSEMTRGAAAASRVIVSPTVLATKELAALESMVEEMQDYPLLITPNKVPRIPNLSMVARLGQVTDRPGITVGPMISEYTWLPRRTQRVAVTSYDKPSKRIAPLDAELRLLAGAVSDYVTAT